MSLMLQLRVSFECSCGVAGWKALHLGQWALPLEMSSLYEARAMGFEEMHTGQTDRPDPGFLEGHFAEKSG